MDFYTIVSQMATLFIVLAAGFFCNKTKLMTDESNRLISKLALNLTMPCTILSSVIGGGVDATGLETIYFMLLVLLAFAVYFIVALPTPFALRTDKTDSGMFGYMVVFGNVGFMGFPITQAVFGDGAAFFTALFNIPFTLLAFSFGIIMVSGGKGRINPKVLINPSLICAFAAVLIFFSGFKTPEIVSNAIKLIGGMTTPCAMLIIGSTLAGIKFRDVFSQWRLYPVAFLKLIVLPVLVWLIFKNFISNGLILGVLVVLSGMPVATTATMLAMQYGGNERLASKGVFLTTLLSLVTVPIIVLLLLT